MRYTGNICDVCKNPFTDTDDVVVCPECATPHHRECYRENGGCVNEHLHGENFTWTPSVQASVATDEAPKAHTVTCPNCSAQVPSGTEVCPNCGMKFVVFGKNLVEIMENLEAENQKADNNDQTQDTDSEDIFRGPYPQNDKTLGHKTNTLGVFMRGNADYYIRKFKKKDMGGGLGFNFAAFFFGPYWFFYRKLYKPGIIFLTIEVCISLFATPAVTNYYNFCVNTFPSLNLDDPAVLESAVAAISGDVGTLMIATTLNIIVGILCGLLANKHYLTYTLSALKHIGKTAKNREEKVSFFSKFGGVSWLAVLICYFGQQLLVSLASFFM